MSTFNATTKEISNAEKIRRQYMSHEADKMEQLKKLDDKVKLPGQILSIILGCVGALTMGGGMSLVMVWGSMQPGLVLGILGMLIALISYPIYKLITNSRKKKYANEIYRLTDEIVNGENKNNN